jgi:hypothetical protein
MIVASRSVDIVPVNRLSMSSAAVLALVAIAMACTASSAATGSTVVGVTVPSATSLSATGCPGNTATITSFGSVLPGTSTTTTADCVVTWGSSNDSATLQLYQTDGTGWAMQSPSLTGAVAYYGFDNSPDDQSLTGNDATFSVAPGDPSYAVGGRRGTSHALDRDGSDYAQAPYSTALDLDTYTVDAWVKVPTTGVSGTTTYIAAKSLTSNARNFTLAVNWSSATTAQVRADLSAGGADIPSATGTSDVADGTWHHLADVVDSAPVDPNKTERVYVDGVLEATRTFSGNVDNPVTPLTIGHDQNIQEFTGQVDELLILPRAVTATELQQYLTDTGGFADYDDDNVGADTNFSEGRNAFAVCLRQLTGTSVAQWWPVDATCAPSNGTYWRPVVASAVDANSRIAHQTAGVDPPSGTARLRFGLRVAADQAPGTYLAPVTFGVVAPEI